MNGKKTGTLFLLPAPLQPYAAGTWDPAALAQTMPAEALRLLRSLDFFIVESERTALRLLSRLKDRESMERLSLKILDEHSADSDIPGLLAEVLDGRDCGFLTEAGMPCIADPGAALVSFAHSKGVGVAPVSGPSSVILALVASGLDAQRFAFLGYLPQDKTARRSAVQRLIKEVRNDGMTRIFIETPYRNDALLADLASLVPDELWLCAASGLCGEDERIVSGPGAQWRSAPLPKIGKIPAVFLFGNRASLKPKNTR
ncbi:MAG TPA: SAM-dependent methyltransferase [Rectinemataceae bacterium]|nr:SAM-dependent methyltransferase [Rectinemataceae bacterium]